MLSSRPLTLLPRRYSTRPSSPPIDPRPHAQARRDLPGHAVIHLQSVRRQPIRRRRRKRLEDQPGDDAGEDGEEAPGVRGEPSRRGEERDQGGDQQGAASFQLGRIAGCPSSRSAWRIPGEAALTAVAGFPDGDLGGSGPVRPSYALSGPLASPAEDARNFDDPEKSHEGFRFTGAQENP